MTLDPRSSTLKIGDILFIYSHTAMLIQEDSYVHHWGSALSEQLCFSLLSNTFGTEATIMCLPFSYPQITSLLLLPPSLPPSNVIINSTSIFSHQTLKEKSGIITHKGQLNL